MAALIREEGEGENVLAGCTFFEYRPGYLLTKLDKISFISHKFQLI